MINNTESKKVYEVQSGVTEYPIGFPFHFNADQTPQLSVVIGHDVLQLNYNCKLSEDKGTLILIPTEEEAEKLTGPDDYSWMDKWVGAHLVIERDIPFVQESDYQLGRISAEQIEHDFDASVMRDQMLAEEIGKHTVDVQAEVEAINTRIDGIQQEYVEDMEDIDAALATKATKTELENAKTTLNIGIQGNAQAIQKTRDDYQASDQNIRADMNAKDSELETILNDHANRLDTLRTDHDDLGDDVSDIQAKIPESASDSNPLVTKQQLLDEEMDVREDLNNGLSELQTQITHQAAAIAGKQDKLIAGDNIIISGNIISATGAGGGVGFDVIVVQELPESGEKGIIYLVPKDSAAPDIYDEYVWVTTTSTFELIGSTKVDLTNYVKNTDYASDTAGVIKVSTVYGIRAGTSNNGYLVGAALPLDKYTDDKIIISKGTLENIKEDLVARAIENAVNTQNLTVGSNEGALYIGEVAGTATIATNNGLDIAAQTKFDTAPTTDDSTTYANALDTSLVRKAQVATAIADAVNNVDALPDQTGNAGKVLTTDGTTASWQEPAGGTKVIFREWEE